MCIHVILKMKFLEYDFDKRKILEWGFEQGWRENFRLFSPSRSLRRYRLRNRGTFAEALSAIGEKERIVYWVILFARAQAMPIILSKKNTGISLFFSICFGRENLLSFSMAMFTRDKDDYLYPIWDFIVSIIAKKKEKKKKRKKKECKILSFFRIIFIIRDY